MRWQLAGLVFFLFFQPVCGQELVLFGDLTVDESGTDQPVPRTFQLVLRTLADVIIGRETVSANGRYRFQGIGSGEYSLAIEVQGVEVERLSLFLRAVPGSLVRRDLRLAWEDIRSRVGKSQRRQASTVYARLDSEAALFENAQRETENGNLRGAAEFLQLIVKRDADDYEAWTELGTVHYRLGEMDKSATCYQTAIKVRADYALAWLNLGKLQLTEREFEKAEEALSKASELEPQLAEAHYLLGEALLQLQEGSRAVSSLERALELEPVEMADAHLRLAALYDAAGYKTRAADECRQFLEKRPDSPRRAEIEAYLNRLEQP